MNWNLVTYGAQLCNGKLWFSNKNFNGLFSIDVVTNELKYISSFPGEKLERWGMHKKCLIYKNRLIFIPAYGNNIHVYAPYDDSMITYQFDSNDLEKDPQIDRVSDAVIRDGCVYILPMDYEGELKKFDVETGTLESVPEFMKQIREVSSDEKKYLLTRADIDNEGCIRFALWDKNILCNYDISKKKLYTHKCRVDHIFSSHIINGQVFIISNEVDSIYTISNNDGIEKLIGSEREQDDYKRKYNRVIKFGSSIIVLPAFDDCVYAVKNGEIVEITKLDMIIKDAPAIGSFDACMVNGDLWILPFGTCDGIVIGEDLAERRRISFELTDEDSKKSILQAIFAEKNASGIMQESKNWGIGDFISAFANGD